ncbi:MAG: PEP-CTERM sorting domain-containing protein [Chitinophagaceae bacterium]|nr:PEP-CTERM sorting domain-containing protein [Rubrivivax sp.]
MKRSHPLAVALATTAALGALQPAVAAPGLYQQVGVLGQYRTDDGMVSNTSIGQSFAASDGSFFSYITCVGSQPGEFCAWTPNPPLPPGAWYQLPSAGSAASAQALTTDYGIHRVRTWSRGTNGVGTGAPGYTAYSSRADSGWRDEISTTSSVPVDITFVVSLHVDWNDSGVWAFQMGRPESYDGDLGYAPMQGQTWSNCDPAGIGIQCAFEFSTGSALTVVPGGANGGVDLIVTLPFTVHPESFPFYQGNTIEAILGARSYANDAEVLGYSTASLQAILVPPGADLSFASGHAYNVQVVPEPATWGLWAIGLLGAGFATRRRRLSREKVRIGQ